MKTLSEIKNKVAQKCGFDNWFVLQFSLATIPFGNCVDEVAKRYAEEVLKEAAEKVKIKWIDDEYDEERRDMISHPEIDKSSILNIIKELK